MHTWIEMLYYSVCINRHVHICSSKEMEKNADGNIVHNSLNWAKSFDCSSSIEGINNLWCSHAVEHYTWRKTTDYWYLQKPRWITHIWLWVKEVTYKRVPTEDVNIYCYKTGKLVYCDKGHNSDYFPVGGQWLWRDMRQVVGLLVMLYILTWVEVIWVYLHGYVL